MNDKCKHGITSRNCHTCFLENTYSCKYSSNRIALDDNSQMMKLIEQVCSFDLAKKLKEIGVKQESLYRWQKIGDFDWEPTGLRRSWFEQHHPDMVIYSAFTSAELLNILPNSVTIPNAEPFDNFRIVVRKFISVDENMIHYNNFIINYECDTTAASGEKAWLATQLTSNVYDPVLANAAATILIYLIENELMPK